MAAGNDGSVAFIGLSPISPSAAKPARDLRDPKLRLLDVCIYLLVIDPARAQIDADGG